MCDNHDNVRGQAKCFCHSDSPFHKKVGAVVRYLTLKVLVFHLPSSLIQEFNWVSIKMEYIESQKRKKGGAKVRHLVIDNYLYRTKGEHKDTVYWTCYTSGCPATVRVVNGNPIEKGEHDIHDDHFLKIQEIKFKLSASPTLSLPPVVE